MDNGRHFYKAFFSSTTTAPQSSLLKPLIHPSFIHSHIHTPLPLWFDTWEPSVLPQASQCPHRYPRCTLATSRSKLLCPPERRRNTTLKLGPTQAKITSLTKWKKRKKRKIPALTDWCYQIDHMPVSCASCQAASLHVPTLHIVWIPLSTRRQERWAARLQQGTAAVQQRHIAAVT